MIYKTLFFLVFTVNVFSQTQTGPKVLILSPNQSTFNKSLEKEMIKKVNDYKKGLDLNEADAFLKSDEFKSRPENVQIMSKSEIDYLRTLDHIKLFSYLTEQHLSYALYEKFPGVIVKLKDLKSSGKIDDLSKIAAEEDVQYILNLYAVELYTDDKKNYAKITAQLYDNESKSTLMELAFNGDWENPGLEYACEEKSLDCCINNAISYLLDEVKELIIANDPGIQQAKQLAKDRIEVLRTIKSKSFDKQNLKGIISPSDKTIDIEKAYQMLFNEDQSKFVAFFIEEVPSANGKAFREAKNDKNVNIVSEDEMSFFSDKLPNTYAYIVKGVKYQNKWYYEKAEVNYFDAETLGEGKSIFFSYLQKWNYFKANSVEINPAFWATEGKGERTLATSKLFQIMPDLKKHPDWEKNKETWKAEEEENRPYVGLDIIVVDQLKEKAAEK